MNFHETFDTCLKELFEGSRSGETYKEPFAVQETSCPVYLEADLRPVLLRALQKEDSWANMSANDRARLFQNLNNVIVQNLDEILAIINLDTGKPASEILMHEIYPVISSIKFFPKTAKRLQTRRTKTPLGMPHMKVKTQWKPLGLTLILSPWNFPFYLAFNQIIQALSAGNVVIFKPSEVTTLTGVLIKTLLKMAGFPVGVMELVSGDGRTGKLLSENPLFSKISFIGSTETGQHLIKNLPLSLPAISLELGGSDPCIVMPDADIKEAAKGVYLASFANSGQVCVSAERVFIHKKIYRPFIQELQKLVSEARVEEITSPSQLDASHGRIIAQRQFQKIEELIDEAQSLGGKIVAGGLKKGSLIEPTILEDVPSDARIMKEETFGPVITVEPYLDEATLIETIESGEFGLNASIFGSSIPKATELAGKITTGHVHINGSLTSMGMVDTCFLGAKKSGFSVSHGEEGLKGFMRPENIILPRYSFMNKLLEFPYSKRKFELQKLLLKVMAKISWL